MGREQTAELTPGERIARDWGLALRRARKDAGYTQTTFAEKVGYTQTTVSSYERGRSPWTPEVLLLFAAHLGATVPELFPWPPFIEQIERFRLGLS